MSLTAALVQSLLSFLQAFADHSYCLPCPSPLSAYKLVSFKALLKHHLLWEALLFSPRSQQNPQHSLVGQAGLGIPHSLL